MTVPRPRRKIHVVGHTLTYGVRIPAHPKLPAYNLPTFDSAKLGAEFVQRILRDGHKFGTEVLPPCEAIPRNDLEGTDQFRTWETTWHPAEPDKEPKTLRIRSIETTRCEEPFRPWEPVSLHPFVPGTVTKHRPRPVVYICMDVSRFNEQVGRNLAVKDADIVVLHVMASDQKPPRHVEDQFREYLENLRRDNPGRLVALLNDRFLAGIGLALTDDRSWEQFATECVQELDPTFKKEPSEGIVMALQQFDHLIIRHHAYAAVHICPRVAAFASFAGPLPSAELETARRGVALRLHYSIRMNRPSPAVPGFLRGLTDTFGAAVAAELAVFGGEPSVDGFDAAVVEGVARGLQGCAQLEATGLFDDERKEKRHDFLRITTIIPKLTDDTGVGVIALPAKASSLYDRRWSVLDVLLREKNKPSSAIDGEHMKDLVFRCQSNAVDLGRHIVQEGLDANATKAFLPFPIVRFSDLTLVDRAGFEDVYEIRAAMRNYLDVFRTAPRAPKPLCLAMFGPPGGGKSFAIKELAKSLGSPAFDPDNGILEINLSQISAPADLAWAFHKIRDSVNRGKVPLVFFDEFDAELGGKPFGWLKTFLAPMQDGTFGVGPDLIDFRSCMFVFVGGLNTTFEMFHGRARDREFIDAKGPDFISRLVRHLNVLGLTKNNLADDDHTYIIRRAVLIRDLLRRVQPGIFRGDTADIDDDVLTALLTVPRFQHGVRSLEGILTTSRLHPDRPRLHWGTLPPERQLEMFVEVASLRRSKTITAPPS